MPNWRKLDVQLTARFAMLERSFGPSASMAMTRRENSRLDPLPDLGTTLAHNSAEVTSGRSRFQHAAIGPPDQRGHRRLRRFHGGGPRARHRWSFAVRRNQDREGTPRGDEAG